MSDYALTGKKGTGKSAGAVTLIKRHALKGWRVATNLNLRVEHLVPLHSRWAPIRIPDKPTASDLFSIGSGNPKIKFDVVYDTKLGSPTYGKAIGTTEPQILEDFSEDQNGMLVLDELGTWLNARSFQDKERMPVLDWLVHARKFGWDVYYIMQNTKQVDAQVRESLLEYQIRFHRVDKINFPFITPMIRLLTAGRSKGTLPKIHIGVMRLGVDPNGLVCDRMVFSGKLVHKAYDTTQVFRSDYPHGVFSYLSRWHLEGYKHPVRSSWLQRAIANVKGLFGPRPIRQWMIHDRKLLVLLWQRETRPEKRQLLLDAIYSLQRKGRLRVRGRMGLSSDPAARMAVFDRLRLARIGGGAAQRDG